VLEREAQNLWASESGLSDSDNVVPEPSGVSGPSDRAATEVGFFWLGTVAQEVLHLACTVSTVPAETAYRGQLASHRPPGGVPKPP
jgi:hypothetical protein